MQSDFVLLQKCQDMASYGFAALRHYPKYERHVMSAEIRQIIQRLIRLVITCSKRYHKKTTLTEMDIE